MAKPPITLIKTLLYGVISIPFMQVVFGVYSSTFLDPIDEILKITGDTVIKLLIASLSISPFVWMLGTKILYVFRRMIGVSAFIYAILHACVWALGQELKLTYMVRDVVKHPYIIVGLVAVILLLPLAITSTNRGVKTLGIKNWKALHKLSYIAIVLGVVHYILQEKSGEPFVNMGIVIILLLVRLLRRAFFINKNNIT